MMFTLVPTALAEDVEGGEWTQVTLLEDAVKAVNSNLDAITKLKVITSGDAELAPADFRFLSGVVVTETKNGRYSSVYAGDGTVYLKNLTELDLSAASCKDNAIPPRAFQGNTKITGIILPETLERTYLHAFSMMSALTYLGTEEGNLTFPSSMKTMGEGMVWEDKNLTGSLTLPANLEAIGSGCFCGSGITGKVVIPGNVKIAVNTDVENGSCGPAKLIFSKTNISSLIFENGITEISESFASGCALLTSVMIPASVKTIGASAFYGTNLTAYPAMEGVTKVGDNAFRGLKNDITGDIELKNGVSYGDRVFLGDTIKGNVTVNSNNVGVNVFDSTKITGNLTINSKTVPSGAIHGSTITGNVTVNSSSIDANAFKKVAIKGDLTINSETVPARLLYQTDTDHDSGKARITGTGNVTLGDGVKVVGSSAFGGAGIPGTLTLPEGLVKIGGSAFRKNKLHGNIVIPESVTEIGGAAFSFAGNKENVLNFIVESTDPTKILSQYAFANQAGGTKIYFMAAVTNSNQYWSGSEVTILNTDGGYVDTTKVDSTTGLLTPSKAGYSFLGWFDGATKLENAAAEGKTYTAKWTLAAPTSVTVSADKTTIAKNTGSATLTATVAPELAADSGIEYHYQWYTGTPETGTAIDSATSQTYTAQNLTEATSYYCTVKASCGEEVSAAVTSSAVTINVAENEGSVVINNSKTTATYGDDPFTFTYTASETATVASSNTSVATVQDNSGTVTVTIVGAGTTEISVGFDGDTDYTAASDKFTLTVNKATPTISISADKTSPIRGGGIVELTVNVNPADSTVTVTQSDNLGTASKALTLTDGKVSVTLDNKDAEYTFTASCAETTNYVANSVTCTVTVTRYTSSGGGSSSGSSYSVSTPSKTENGTVTVSPKSASKGDTVTITVKPDSGYTLETLTVIDSKGNEIQLTDKGEGKYTFTMPAGKVEVKATFMDDNTMLNFFVDVKSGDYYYDAVLWAAKNGITSGTDAVHFSPEQPCTRAQIVTFLWRAAGAPEPKGTAASLTDVVSGSYYEKAVAWAIENGITTGTGDGEFSPDDTCTRAQAVTFLARALSAKAASVAEFSDVPTDSYFADAVAWAAANGVTEGVGNGMFAPDNDCTRGQIVTFLFRAYNK